MVGRIPQDDSDGEFSFRKNCQNKQRHRRWFDKESGQTGVEIRFAEK